MGIGFVTQPLNYDQVIAMADYAAGLGVDFLDVRKDEVDVTNGLTPEQIRTLRWQLHTVRATAVADSAFNLGVVSRQPLGELVAALPEQFVPDRCAQCMPSSRTGNGVYHKLLTDLRDGVGLTEQPFAPDVTTPR